MRIRIPERGQKDKRRHPFVRHASSDATGYSRKMLIPKPKGHVQMSHELATARTLAFQQRILTYNSSYNNSKYIYSIISIAYGFKKMVCCTVVHHNQNMVSKSLIAFVGCWQNNICRRKVYYCFGAHSGITTLRQLIGYTLDILN